MDSNENSKPLITGNESSEAPNHDSQIANRESRITSNGSLGVVFDIQELSLHDGEGIRTTVFMKGCPLVCAWCSNPEGQGFRPELLCFFSKLKHVKNLENLCDKDAIRKDKSGNPVFRKQVCDKCTDRVCIENSLHEELRLAGKRISAKELYKKVQAYTVFYENSNGGVTLSGGEPLVQPAFVREFLNLCAAGGITVGLETSGYFVWEDVKDFINKFDFIYYDIKHTDPEIHEQLTGKSNRLILENLHRLAEIMHEKITVSIPVIEPVNTSEENITAVASLLKKLNITKTRLLPYHAMGVQKYEELGRKYTLTSAAPPSHKTLLHLQSLLQSHNLTCTL